MAKRRIKAKEGRRLFNGRNEKEIIAKLEQVWGIGGSDAEASFYADITPSQICRYLQSHPLVSQRKAALLQKPILKARQELVKGLDGDPELALKFLERKLPDEFGIRQKIEHKGQIMSLTQIVTIVNGNNGNDNDKQARTKTGERFSKEML